MPRRGSVSDIGRMEASYGVTWQTDDMTAQGRLVINKDSIKLIDCEDGTTLAGIRLDDLVALELEPGAASSRPTVILEPRQGSRIEIQSRVHAWILAELLERALAHVTTVPARRRVLIAVGLRPGARENALALLRDGPPFDLSQTSLVSHEVFVAGNEVLFLFETDGREASDQRLPLFELVSAWQELVAEITIADEAYSWSRGDLAGLQRSPTCFGLGF